MYVKPSTYPDDVKRVVAHVSYLRVAVVHEVNQVSGSL